MSTAAHKAACERSNDYAALMDELKSLAVLESVNALVAWDQETMMPPKGAAARADQLQLLSGLVHERAVAKTIGQRLEACEKDDSLTSDDFIAANLREIRRAYDQATKLPRDLVEEMAKCASLGMEAWKTARANNDFKTFLPWLQKTVDLNRRKAECLGVPDGADELYDALMDIYEPGMTAKRTDEIFGPLREKLVPLIAAARDSADQPDHSIVEQNFPIELQKKFVEAACARCGFDFEAGRLDLSTHPFCEGVAPGDTRMTNRYREDGWADAISTALHEGGHATYEQGLPKEDLYGTPMAEYISLGIHESQSRMWENLVGRSRQFWDWALPLAKDTFNNDLRGADVESVFRAMNIVKPHFIRVESDEVTYNLHIMLRFDLERAMIRGDLNCADLPGVWNERMKNDLGLTVKEDRLGCLQDVHWSMGAIGYFATYTFGNLYAAQFWNAMADDLPNREEQMAKGEFTPILDWLRQNIHRHGRRYHAEDLCKRITGAPLDSTHLVNYLENKVKTVYKL